MTKRLRTNAYNCHTKRITDKIKDELLNLWVTYFQCNPRQQNYLDNKDQNN